MRPSTEVKVISTGTLLVCFVVGIVFATACGFFLYLDIREPGELHTMHIALFLGGAMFGILFALPKQSLPLVQKIVIIIGPYIPGGRRAGDPPAPPPSGGDT